MRFGIHGEHGLLAGTNVDVRRMGRSLRAPGKEKQIDYAIPLVLLAPWAPVPAGR